MVALSQPYGTGAVKVGQAAVEMNATPEYVVTTLKSMPEYIEYFKKAFPEESDPVSFENITKAIEAFEATLITPSSKLDQ